MSTPRRATFETSLAGIPGVVARSGEPLARYTTFRIGGPAEWLVDIPSQRALLAVAWTGSRYPAGPYTVLWDGKGRIGFPLTRVAVRSHHTRGLVQHQVYLALRTQCLAITLNRIVRQ